MKYIIFGNLDAETGSVLSNVPYEIEYLVSNVESNCEFAGKRVYTSLKLFEENMEDIYIFISNMKNYAELADQLVKMGFIEGKHFSGAIEYSYNEWETSGRFNDLFTVRIKHMSSYIASETKTILDLGCGNQHLKKFLDNEIEYIGVDYIARDEKTLVCDFNKGEFPNRFVDTVFCSGCLEYIDDVDWFIKEMCRSAKNEVILSYCPLEYKNDILERGKLGWKNHMTIHQIVEHMKNKGFVLIDAEKSIGANVIYHFVNERKNLVEEVQCKNLTYLENDALNDLLDALAKVKNVEGRIIEAGCALGGSAICMAGEKAKERELYVYDVFGMIPEPGERDGEDVKERYKVIKDGQSVGIGGDLYYGYQENLLAVVENNFLNILNIDNLQDRNVFLVKGLFEDTLECTAPVALAHIDCDWYDSVMVCLERIVPMLAPGGILVIDDYYHWSGSREAVDDYFKDKKEEYIFEKKSRLHIKKK